MNEFLQIFSYSFMIRAIIVGVLISLCSALLGVSLVLKRYSMIGDGLSHVGFGAMAIASALGLAPLPVAIPIVALSAILLLKLSNNSKLKGDSAIAVISTSALALGITIVSLKGTNTDLSNYMFGSILAVSKTETLLSVILAIMVIFIFIFFYHRIFAITFDRDFSKATGINVKLFDTLLAVLTALTVVVGMRMMGTLLISSLIIFPPISAIKICKTFKGVTVLSAVFSVFAFLIGLICSSLLSTPTGATIVLSNLSILILSSLYKKVSDKIKLKKQI